MNLGVLVGGAAVVGLLASLVRRPTAKTGEDPFPDDDFHVQIPTPAPPTPPPTYTPVPTPTPAPQIKPAQPLTRPLPPPDPGREDRIARLFVLETEDAPLPPGGQQAIERRYAMAAEWVRQKVGRRIAYHPDVTYLQVPYAFNEIRNIVLYPVLYPGGLPALIFDKLEEYVAVKGLASDNPRERTLRPLNQVFMFIVRGAGGYAGGHAWRPGDQEEVGWAIMGDAVLSAWLSDAGLEDNIAADVIFLRTHDGYEENEMGWDESKVAMSYELRQRYGQADAQTGSFIHESFHAIFNAVHVGRKALADIGRENEWLEDPVDNIMGGSHLDWPDTAIQQVTLAEIDDVDYYVT